MAPSSRGLGPRTTVWALQSLLRAPRAPAGPGRYGTGRQGAVGTTQLPRHSSAGRAEMGWQPLCLTPLWSGTCVARSSLTVELQVLLLGITLTCTFE